MKDKDWLNVIYRLGPDVEFGEFFTNRELTEPLDSFTIEMDKSRFWEIDMVPGKRFWEPHKPEFRSFDYTPFPSITVRTVLKSTLDERKGDTPRSHFVSTVAKERYVKEAEAIINAGLLSFARRI